MVVLRALDPGFQYIENGYEAGCCHLECLLDSNDAMDSVTGFAGSLDDPCIPPTVFQPFGLHPAPSPVSPIDYLWCETNGNHSECCNMQHSNEQC